MKKIALVSLRLNNFKGIRSLTVNFGHITNIYGDNATGKTTLFDAFLWLLFGKDSSDRKDFEIKTLDENNNPYHKLDHEVAGVLLVDGEEIHLRRVYREKWTTKRGTTQEVFAGHETAYFWNEVPLKQEEFQAKISGLLDENVFKLITNTNYFNSLKWQDRRAVLMQIAGAIDDDYVLDLITDSNNKELIAQLASALNQRKSIDEYKREVAAKKKKIKDELAVLPSRIDEANRSLPEEKDYEAIEANIQQVTNDLQSVESLLNSKSAAAKEHEAKVNRLLARRMELNKRLHEIEQSLASDVQDRKRARETKIQSERTVLRGLQDKLQDTRTQYTQTSERKAKKEKERELLREEYAKVNAQQLQFNDGEFCCPTCKRDFEPDQIEAKKEELRKNFNKYKSETLDRLTQRGQSLNTEIEDLSLRLSNLEATGKELNGEITIITERIAELETEHNRLSADDAEQLKAAIAGNAQYQETIKEIEKVTEEINAPAAVEDNSALQFRKRELAQQLDALKKELATKDIRDRQLARIAELEAQEKAMAQELASYEGIEYTIDQFISEKMNALERMVNDRFKIVRFKMFEEQINGGRSEACTTLINGVPYSDANTAAKIQAGLDIINVLCAHYGVQAPVWVDNRESVVMLPETDCQLINLVVSASDRKLRVESEEMEAVA